VGIRVILPTPNTGRCRQPWQHTWLQPRRQRSSQQIWALARLNFVWRDDGASFAVHPAVANRHHGSPNAVTPAPPRRCLQMPCQNAPTAAPTLSVAAGPAIGPAGASPTHHLTPPRSAPGATSTDRHKVVRRRWTDEADYLLLKEVVVAKAHMSPWGKLTERFQVVTNNFNAYPRVTFKTDHKHANDRFQLLAKSFEALDKKRATKTGTEEVLTPMELLLVDVVEEMNGFNERTAAEREERTAAEEKFFKNGEQTRRLAMAKRGKGTTASNFITSNGSGGGGFMKPSPTRRRGRPEDFDDAEFVAMLERSDKRKQDMAASELALREKQLAHDEAVLAEARLRREEESRARVEQETRSAVDAAAARQTNLALARIMERLSE